jgi:hypothetical protein
MAKAIKSSMGSEFPVESMELFSPMLWRVWLAVFLAKEEALPMLRLLALEQGKGFG